MAGKSRERRRGSFGRVLHITKRVNHFCTNQNRKRNEPSGLSAWKISQYSLWFAFPCPAHFPFIFSIYFFLFFFLLFFVFQRHFTAAFHGVGILGGGRRKTEATLRHCLVQKLNNFIKYSNGAATTAKKRNKLQSAQKEEHTDFVSKKVSGKKTGSQ